jgi:ABC-type multidrug transport system fused ATPase/permease subunit
LQTKPDKRAELYRNRLIKHEADAERLGARSRLVSNLRGLTFGVMVVAVLFFVFSSARWLAVGIATAAGAAFAVLLVVHARVLAAEDTARRWAQVNRYALARCTGRWTELPDDGAQFADSSHPYAEDLDLFGTASLFQRLCVAHTSFGQATLAGYFTQPAPVCTIRARQEAVRELGPQLDLRQRLQALALAVVDPAGRGGADGAGNDSARDRAAELPHRQASARRRAAAPDPEPLLRWAEAEPRLSQRPLLVHCSRLLPPLTLAGLLGSLLWHLPAWSWAVPFMGQLAVILATRAETARVFAAVSSQQGAFLRYGAMLQLMETMDVSSGLLRAERTRLLSGPVQPSVAMQRFRNTVGWFDLRHNGLVHPFVNALLLWDVHCLLRLEAWQRRSGKAARGWFEVLGQLEALCALAGLAHDEPGFSFPEIAEQSACFEAVGLGHPLIEATQRVVNDVSLPQPGSVMLVTGSNMSGKSTLLRAMGLAGVMAMAGAPVCAQQLRIARCCVRTSIRVVDSLQRGVSHFYVELRTLKGVLDATAGPLPVLFLLDEILHGTNSRERQIGARWLLSELIRRGALGAASTHDMGLTRLPDDLSERTQLVHFRESVRDNQMTFDYRLRAGPVLAGNALRLMRQVGLDVPLD